MKIIAHFITNIREAQNALSNGADFLEIDVAKRSIFPKFIIQHHGLKGKLGIGARLSTLITPETQNKLFLDIKHAKYSLTFANRLSKFLKKLSINSSRLCGRDWRIISKVCQNNGLLPFYTIIKSKDLEEIKKALPYIKKPAGFSVNHLLIDKELIGNLKSNFPKSQIWAWTINDFKTAKNLKRLNIDGIITDNYEELSLLKK